MTDDIEARARDLMDQVAALGGAVAAIEEGFQKAEIERSAYRIAREVDSGERKVVGVNAYVSAHEEPYEPLRVDPAIEQQQAQNSLVTNLQSQAQLDTANLMTRYGTRLALSGSGMTPMADSASPVPTFKAA